VAVEPLQEKTCPKRPKRSSSRATKTNPSCCACLPHLSSLGPTLHLLPVQHPAVDGDGNPSFASCCSSRILKGDVKARGDANSMTMRPHVLLLLMMTMTMIPGVLAKFESCLDQRQEIAPRVSAGVGNLSETKSACVHKP
jgi:hypothetical protein